MKNLFESVYVREIEERIGSLTPNHQRMWGSMGVAQMMAHCSAWMEMAAGLSTPPRSLLGRVFGKIAKRSVLGDGTIRRNMPTEKSLIMKGEFKFLDEQRRLLGWIERFASGGPEQCTKHPHCFFGYMTPSEWSALGYKHLDHHLRQFGA